VTAVLEVENLAKRFGGVQAVDGVNFSIDSGRRFAIIGPNGAGKTTLLNIITGIIRPDSGVIRLTGEVMSRRPVAARVTRGMARTLQAPVVFPELTVLENVQLGHFAHWNVSFTAALLGLPRMRRWQDEARTNARELLGLLGISALADRPAGELPLGQRRLVEIGRALATQPKIILLDEPAAGLARGEVDRLAELLVATSERGVAVCVVEHNMRLVMRIAHEIYVLHHGQPLFRGTPAEVQRHPEVISAYLGSRYSVERQTRA
jgi:ABC-type branched-subunit amino acid transport system ATPase component